MAGIPRLSCTVLVSMSRYKASDKPEVKILLAWFDGRFGTSIKETDCWTCALLLKLCLRSNLLLMTEQASLSAFELQSMSKCLGCSRSFDNSSNLQRHCQNRPNDTLCKVWFVHTLLPALRQHTSDGSIHDQLSSQPGGSTHQRLSRQPEVSTHERLSRAAGGKLTISYE